MARLILLLGYLVLSQGANQCVAWAAELCPGFTLEGEIKPGLTDTEHQLLCGVPKSESSAWKVIPLEQLKYNLKNFLQQRGYHHPEFTQNGVNVGPATRVTVLRAEGAPEELRIYRRRKIIDQVLTPSLLGEVEQWVTQRMRALGYPCPEVNTEADIDSGEIVVNVKPGPMQDLVSISEDPLPGALPGVVRRYDAFQLGKPFNGDLLTVTENRVIGLNIVQSTYFSSKCGEKGAEAHQYVTTGPPRMVGVGFGANTEGLLLLKASWRNARLGTHVSWADVTGQASFKEQRLTGVFNWFWLPEVSRLHMQPLLQFRRQNETTFEVLSTRLKWALATSWDNQVLGMEFALGPSLDFYRTLRGSGSGDPNTRFLSLEGTFRLRSHDFEYWATSPRSGYSVGATFALATDKVLSSSSAQRLELVGETLLNYRGYDPPLWVLGIRGGIGTTVSPERPGPNTRLPANFFRYLGGSIDVRGFDRRSIPPGGAMTSAFLDTELRWVGFSPLGFEPLAFMDLGVVGLSPLSFDSPLLRSPGIGLRWQSPVGVFRTTLAHGYPVEPSGGWTFYFSYGEEF